MPFVKADKNQCQAYKQDSFMQFGPIRNRRCASVPVVIAKENRPRKGYKNRGSMSLCDSCKADFLRRMGENYATLIPINEEVSDESV